jgi:hydrogenase maturation protease
LKERDNILLIAIGNSYRGDDAIGIIIGDEYKKIYPEAEVVKVEDDLTRLLQVWSGRRVVLVDCLHAHEVLDGEIIEYDSIYKILHKRKTFSSSHNLSLLEVLELSNIMGMSPAGLHFVGVVGSQFHLGKKPSKAVLRAIPEAVNKIREQMS